MAFWDEVRDLIPREIRNIVPNEVKSGPGLVAVGVAALGGGLYSAGYFSTAGAAASAAGTTIIPTSIGTEIIATSTVGAAATTGAGAGASIISGSSIWGAVGGGALSLMKGYADVAIRRSLMGDNVMPRNPNDPNGRSIPFIGGSVPAYGGIGDTGGFFSSGGSFNYLPWIIGGGLILLLLFLGKK